MIRRAFWAFLLATIWATAPAAAQPFVDGEVFAGLPGGQLGRFSEGRANGVLRSPAGGQMTGMCFDAEGRLYATNFSRQRVALFDRDGDLVRDAWASGFDGKPESCVVDASGNVYVGSVDGQSKLIQFDSDGRRIRTFHPLTGPRGMDWIDLAADQCTLFYTSEGPTIRRFDVCSNTQLADFADLSGTCFALRIRENGEVMVACGDRVYRLAASGRTEQRYTIPNETLFGLNLDRDGRTFWTGGIATANVYRIDIDSGDGAAAPLFNAVGAPPRRRRQEPPKNFFEMLEDLTEGLGEAFKGERMGGLAVFGEKVAALKFDAPPPFSLEPPPAETNAEVAEPEPPALDTAPAEPPNLTPAPQDQPAPVGVAEPEEVAKPEEEVKPEPAPAAVDEPAPAFDVASKAPPAEEPKIETLPPPPETPREPWLRRHWRSLLTVAGAALLAGLGIYGFWAPSRFAPRAGLMLSPEEDLAEGFFHAFRAQRGSRSGFYRDARLYLCEDFRFGRRSAGAWLRLRAAGKQVRMAPIGGTGLWRRTVDGVWERVGSGEAPLRPGVLHKNELGTIFFELRQK